MFRERLKELTSVIYNCVCTDTISQINHKEALDQAHQLLYSVDKENGKVYLIGDGRSSGIASHVAADLINTLKISAITLFDPNLMACMSNDHGHQKVFSEPLKVLIDEADLLVAISSSGSSSGILQAVQVAKEKGAKTLTLSGFKATNPLRYMGDLNLWIESEDPGIVESSHFFLLHTIIEFCAQSNDKVVGKDSDSHVLV